MEALTYEQLFDALRREKSRDDLQKLDREFYGEVRRFLDSKHESMMAANAQGYGGLGAQRASIEYQNSKRIIKELYDRRERKIVTLALHKMRTESAIIDLSILSPEENVFYSTLVECLVQSRTQIFSAMGIDNMIPLQTTHIEQESIPEHNPAHKNIHTSAHASMSDAPPLSYAKNNQDDDVSEDGDEEDADGDVVQIVAPPGMIRVEITAAIPKVMGGDGKIYGPCNAGETIFLPNDVANVLLKKGRAKAA